MARDLGSEAGEVHARAAEVLRFWFDETPANKRFAKDDAFDALIRERFGALRDAVARSDAAGWDGAPGTLLAALILLDQFSRNLYRGQAEAFAADAVARTLAGKAIDAGWDREMPTERRLFLYIPFMHSEDRVDQGRSLALFETLGEPEQITYARLHADQIERFGRFPGRNQALGRVSTPGERDLLSRPGAAF